MVTLRFNVRQIQFRDTTVGAPVSWAWDFGDDETSTAQHPSHTYANPDTYLVRLDVADASGRTACVIKQIIVDFNPVEIEITSLSGTGEMAGITELSDVSDPPRKYLKLYPNNVDIQRSAPGVLALYSANATDATKFNTAGSKTSQMTVGGRGGGTGNWSQTTGGGPGSIPTGTPWAPANSGHGTAGGSEEDSYEDRTPNAGWGSYWYDWLKTKTTKKVGYSQITRSPGEYFESPGFSWCSQLIGSATSGYNRTNLRSTIFWFAGRWRLAGFYSISSPPIGGPISAVLRYLAAPGNQRIGDAADGKVIHASVTSGTFWFTLDFLPNVSVRLWLRLGTEPPGHFPRDLDNEADEEEAGLHPWIYLPEDPDSDIVGAYEEILASEDTPEAALERGSSTSEVVTLSEACAESTSFTGGITAESHDEIDVAATVLKLVFSRLTAGRQYDYTLEFRESVIGETGFEDVEVTGSFISTSDTYSYVRVVAPVGKRWDAVAFSAVNAGPDPTPVLPEPGTPLLPPISDQAFKAHETVSIDISAVNEVDSYEAEGLPDSLTINASTGEITGVPVVAEIGTHSVLVTAENTIGSDTTEFDIIVTAPPLPLVSEFAGADLEAAYGLRPIVAGYIGNLFRLRRDSDDTEQTFAVGYDYGDVDAFLAGATGYVTTLYDQTGNGHDKTQTSESLQFPVGYHGPDAHLVMISDSVTRYFVEAATLTSRAVVAALQIEDASDLGSGLVCNQNDEGTEIRKVFGSAETWDTYSYTPDIYVDEVDTANYSAGAWQVPRFQRASDVSFSNPHVIFSSRPSLNRQFTGYFADLLFFNASGAAHAAQAAADFKALWAQV